MWKSLLPGVAEVNSVDVSKGKVDKQQEQKVLLMGLDEEEACINAGLLKHAESEKIPQYEFEWVELLEPAPIAEEEESDSNSKRLVAPGDIFTLLLVSFPECIDDVFLTGCKSPDTERAVGVRGLRQKLASQKVPSPMTTMLTSLRTSLHGIRRWETESMGPHHSQSQALGRGSSLDPAGISQQTRLSTWTPVIHRKANQQLFDERVTLVSHWFDLWTDKQRRRFLRSVLTRCSKSQLKFIQDWFTETVPVARLDFTTILPRFLSLYIFSFLNPRELCSVSQVSWYWRFLSEQDCLWMPKCVKQGWFLPYTPPDHEYGAWKRHYVACACSLDYLTPLETAKIYGVLEEPKEITEERWNEKFLRRLIQDRLARQKKESLRTRPPWLSGRWNSPRCDTRHHISRSQTSLEDPRLSTTLLQLTDKKLHINVTLSQLLREEIKSSAVWTPALEKQRVLRSLGSLHTRKNLAGGGSYPVLPHSEAARSVNNSSDQPQVVLISSRIPAWEMVVDCVKVGVMSVVYDHSGTTLDSLLRRVEKVLRGRGARSIGIVAEGDPTEINMVQGCKISSKNLQDAKIRRFWENLSGYVLPQEDGGHIDIFVPLAGSEAGMELLSQLSTLTAVYYSSPTGVVTGSYQHILSEWLWNAKDPAPPAIYFNEEKLQEWSRMAQVQEELLRTVRKQMRLYFRQLQRDVCARTIGQLMFDSMSATKVQHNQEVAQALTEGLIAMTKEKQEKPLEFLAGFLNSRSGKSKSLKAAETFLTLGGGGIDLMKEGAVGEAGRQDYDSQPLQGHEETNQELIYLNRRPGGEFVEKRTQVARETLSSEQSYVQTLEIVKDIYCAPLRAALASNRAILSMANIHTIFSDILSILELNRDLLRDLRDRLSEWGPSQCLGDIFLKFSTRLTNYTNFFNNYSAILNIIDKCRNTTPGFRAFLARHDRSATTKMLSLPEILLTPSSRFEEYVTLLCALRLHTPVEHVDRHDLNTATAHLKCFRDHIRQLKLRSERDQQIMEAQRSIAGTPVLLEANRYLIQVQEVAQMSCLDGKICPSFRVYEHINDMSLFLFNDTLVFTSRTISHLPFERSPKTSLQFSAAVALPRLLIEDVPDSKYIQNAFVLRGPKRQWICATDTEEDKVTWLSILEGAVRAAVKET
ncbi:epithelial cell-transforming sequence 2 oncogene-like [Carcharodon carcharias]|uniref:epithelial cell-transforming sequence 2 oncogene-like n=1 Tax=Carcharodon carcharias TaxID=13397 RepID=UPI001B7F76F7|nr:epithelial cell-transforming sequence 2 oncogene-like [Carcharodon carcharias]